jgi:hypothetical protein
MSCRTLKSFRKSGILSEFAGVAVTHRYVNYRHGGWKQIAGHEACLAHVLHRLMLGDPWTPPAPAPA